MILVTGAAGFVGRTTCAMLRARSMPVVEVVRRQVTPQQIAVGNIDSTTDWSAALQGVDAVIHLMARVHVMREAARDPLGSFRDCNVAATLNLARQAAAHKVRRLVYVSSLKVLGENSDGRPFCASDHPQPRDPYGQSKLEAEIGLRDIAGQTGLELVIVRPPLVYGPGVGANFLRLMQLVRSGLPLPFRNVSNQRGMVAVDNLADLLILCAGSARAAGQTFLVSDGVDLSLPDLIRLLAGSMNRRARLWSLPVSWLWLAARLSGQGQVAQRLLGSSQIDMTATRQVLGWQPPVPAELAMRNTVSDFLQRKGPAQ